LKIWIDLDNSPHVPFFIPIKEQLEKKGHSVIVTTRDSFQTRALADYHKLTHRTIGTHYGANKFLKVAGTFWRALQLAPTILSERPHLSRSHGSRALIILSSLLRIPTILFFDYEHARMLPLIRPALGIAPEVIDKSRVASEFRYGLHTYPGLKEDVYVASFSPDPSILKTLQIDGGEILATIRPPATEAHYHNPASEGLFVEAVEYLTGVPDVRLVIVPRNERTQRDFIHKTWPEACHSGKIIVPERPVNGLDLIWYSDLVISGGGTMNREAAALGVPVYSIFRGEIGAVDKYLTEMGRLVLIEQIEDVRSKIRPVKRVRPNGPAIGESVTLAQIMTLIAEYLEKSDLA